MQEQSISAPLFTFLSEAKACSLRGQQITFQSICSLQPFTSTNHILKLINNTLLLQHSNSLTLSLQINFDVKFEILYQDEKNISSSMISIRFYDEDQRTLKIFQKTSIIQQWVEVLKKKINQKGFHIFFKPIKKLGKGHFATVYEAERETDHTKFAVKAFVKQNCFSTKNGKQSLINQLAVLRQLNKQPHPNILRLEGVYQSDNSIYVVLELLDGKTLYNVIQDKGGRFSGKEIKGILKGILKGLKHMHERRIMHRDLKPQNIMIRGDSLDPVIVDFGLATNADLNQYIFFRCGTPGFVAPEIINLAQPEHIEPVCDIFSLGAIFHLLLCKKSLFAGSKYEQVYQNNTQCKIELDKINLGRQSCALQLLKKMLVLDPKRRISASEAINHLYFSEQDSVNQDDYKITSPILTDISNHRSPQMKRMGLLFY